MPRPRIDLPKSAADIWLKLAAATALAILIAITASGFANIPGAIPFRFSMNGWPTPYGDRLPYLFLPLVGTLVFVLVQLLTLRVHRFPYPVRITHFNAASEYRSAIRMMRFLVTMLLLGLTYVEYQTVQVGLGGYETPGMWLVALYAMVMIAGTVYFLRQLYTPAEEVPTLQF
ncbi:hypothetical protein [Lewinella sp. IMCC34191]|uniref:hypothetical protein n=1 Tax=Lewinella sp. IMCC34191 TaxID=2259172 RepID=UPI000E27430C|nr:hypothetical protein [Lewinella sp. IMCC34191]